MVTHRQYKWQTVAETFEQICKGEQLWVALGNFLNDWWYFSTDHRRELIETPIIPAPTPDLHYWAVFCAAMVEWLCEQDNVPCPTWTMKECYILPKPWFYDVGWSRRTNLLATTPAAFKRRNMFVGNRMFLGKRDLKALPEPAHKKTAQEMGFT
ncbi:MAG: hypothetical protein NVS4B11_14630 [Ktedonobacteraceae bacterium]